MAYIKFSFLLLALVFGSSQCIDYCKLLSCYGNPHIACNNTGVFSSNCDKYYNVTKIGFNGYLQNLILDGHNTLRNQIASGNISNFPSASRMPRIVWDNELAYLADLNTKQCKMQHDSCRNTLWLDFSGQNLGALSTTGTLVNENFIRNMINTWWNEIRNANVSDINNYSTISSSGQVIGHFTVMANDHVTRVGCGLTIYQYISATGTAWKTALLACNYASTNIIDYPVYQSGPVAKYCPSGADSLYTGLCNITNKINPNFF